MVRRVALPAKLSLLVGASFGTASAHALSTPRHPSAHLADNSATLAPDMVYTSHSALPAPGRRGFYETRWCSLKTSVRKPRRSGATLASSGAHAVSYTHLTLPTICSV